MKKVVICSTFVFFLCACSSERKLGITSGEYYEQMKKNYRSVEWTDFQLVQHRQPQLFRGKNSSHVIVRNPTDSNGVVALLLDNGHVVMNKDSLVYVYYPNAEISIYHQNAQKLQNFDLNLYELIFKAFTEDIAFAESYSPLLEPFSGVSILNATDSLLVDGRYAKIQAKIWRKICTPVTCYMQELPLELSFDTKGERALIGIEHLPFKSRSIDKYTINNIQHRDLSARMEELTNIAKYQQEGYSVNRSDTIPPYHMVATEINDTLDKVALDFSFVNEVTKNTVRISDNHGWLILCPWNSKHSFRQGEQLIKELNNECKILLINTENNNPCYAEKITGNSKYKRYSFRGEAYRLFFPKDEVLLISPDNIVRLRSSQFSSIEDFLKSARTLIQ